MGGQWIELDSCVICRMLDLLTDYIFLLCCKCSRCHRRVLIRLWVRFNERPQLFRYCQQIYPYFGHSSSTRFILYPKKFCEEVYPSIFQFEQRDLSVSHAKIIESSFKPVFDFLINIFEFVRLDKRKFSDRGSFI